MKYARMSPNCPDSTLPFMSMGSFIQVPKTWTESSMVKVLEFMLPSARLEVALIVPRVTFTFSSAQKLPVSESYRIFSEVSRSSSAVRGTAWAKNRQSARTSMLNRFIAGPPLRMSSNAPQKNLGKGAGGLVHVPRGDDAGHHRRRGGDHVDVDLLRRQDREHLGRDRRTPRKVLPHQPHLCHVRIERHPLGLNDGGELRADRDGLLQAGFLYDEGDVVGLAPHDALHDHLGSDVPGRKAREKTGRYPGNVGNAEHRYFRHIRVGDDPLHDAVPRGVLSIAHRNSTPFPEKQAVAPVLAQFDDLGAFGALGQHKEARPDVIPGENRAHELRHHVGIVGREGEHARSRSADGHAGALGNFPDLLEDRLATGEEPRPEGLVQTVVHRPGEVVPVSHRPGRRQEGRPAEVIDGVLQRNLLRERPSGLGGAQLDGRDAISIIIS